MEKPTKLDLASEFERFANDQWVGTHYSNDNAVAAMFDRFRKIIDQELQLIELRASVEKTDA